MSKFPLQFFTDLMRTAPFQPATNLWRAVELTFLIEKAFPLLTDVHNCLDLGCGDGQVMALLKPHLPSSLIVTGVDVDPMETRLAKQTHLYSEVHCVGGDTIPLPDACQDAVISNSVLEHVKPIDDVLAEASRVLKENGLFIATVPSATFHDCLNGSWLPHVSKEDYNKTIDKRLAHLRYWSQTEWRDALDKTGIKLLHFTPYLSAKETHRWELLSRLTGGLLYALMGKKKQPISIQRSMGMRKGNKLPVWIADKIARLCAYGLKEEGAEMHSCVLVIGRKS